MIAVYLIDLGCVEDRNGLHEDQDQPISSPDRWSNFFEDNHREQHIITKISATAGVTDRGVVRVEHFLWA